MPEASPTPAPTSPDPDPAPGASARPPAPDLVDRSWLTFDREPWRTALATRPVAVLLGGTSSERAVSLVSGAAIHGALRGRPELASVALWTIREDGTWELPGEPPRRPAAILAAHPDTLVVLALHGGEGEDGTVQGLLRSAGHAHTGSGVAASSLCMDKHLSRLAFAHAGLRVAPGLLVPTGAFEGERDAWLERLAALGPGPWFVKPRRGGSSVATTRAVDRDGLARGVEAAHIAGDDALVEQGVAGVECTVGVIGGGEDAHALPVVEIRPKDGRFFDYEEKYSDAGAEECCPPVSLDAAQQAELRRLGLLAHRTAGCTGHARHDFLVPAEGAPVILETNTLPGFTPRSLLPQAAAASGVAFPELCLELCARALGPTP